MYVDSHFPYIFSYVMTTQTRFGKDACEGQHRIIISSKTDQAMLGLKLLQSGFCLYFRGKRDFEDRPVTEGTEQLRKAHRRLLHRPLIFDHLLEDLTEPLLLILLPDLERMLLALQVMKLVVEWMLLLLGRVLAMLAVRHVWLQKN
jgi:hypothetical protein